MREWSWESWKMKVTIKDIENKENIIVSIVEGYQREVVEEWVLIA